MYRRFPFTRQLEPRDCGPACLHMICRYYGKYVDLEYIRRITGVGRDGISLYDFAVAAEHLHIKCESYRLTFDDLKNSVPLPCVVLWKERHFVVVYKITNKRVCIADPSIGLVSYSKNEFQKNWLDTLNSSGICVGFEPTADFNEVVNEGKSANYLESFGFIKSYLAPYKRQIIEILIVMLAITFLNTLIPIISQSIIDSGIPRQDNEFINIMLVASIALGLGIALGGWLQKSISLFFAVRVKICMMADYIARMFRMPINFFESRTTGGIIQRNYDFDRIEDLLLNAFFSFALSLMYILVFGALLYAYNPTLFLIFFVGSVLYIAWVIMFWSARKKMDINYYSYLAQNQSQWIEFVTCVTDFKLFGSGGIERKKWERIQVGLFKTRIKLLNIDQLQELGTSLISSLRDALMLYVSARLVILGEVSVGAMAAVLYLIGQLRGPLNGIVNFIVSGQLFLISYGRVTDVFRAKTENDTVGTNDMLLSSDDDLVVHNLYYRYSNRSAFAVNNVTVRIPSGKITAIVGASGSGKSTFLKVLAQLYAPTSGSIYSGCIKLDSIAVQSWRTRIGVVTQDSSLVKDTITDNIVFGREFDAEKVRMAAMISNVDKEIESFPNGYDTILRENGKGLSEGQKQRILLARAIYDNPDYIFLDEMTSLLDPQNEKELMLSIKKYLKGKTIVLVAHRVSTIQMSDYICVMKNGYLTESGTCQELLNNKGTYYSMFQANKYMTDGDRQD